MVLVVGDYLYIFQHSRSLELYNYNVGLFDDIYYHVNFVIIMLDYSIIYIIMLKLSGTFYLK